MLGFKERVGFLAGVVTGVVLGVIVETNSHGIFDRSMFMLSSEAALGVAYAMSDRGRTRFKYLGLNQGKIGFTNRVKGPKVSASGVSTMY